MMVSGPWVRVAFVGAFLVGVSCSNYHAVDSADDGGGSPSSSSSGGSSSSGSGSSSGGRAGSSSGGSGGGGSGSSSGGSSGSSSGSGSGGMDAGACSVSFATSAGLVAYFPFDGDANDYSGHGYNATAQNVLSTAGVIGSAFEFNGSSSSVVVSSGVTTPSATRTFCAWIKPNVGTTGAGWPIILSGTSIANPSSSFDQFALTSSTNLTTCNVVASSPFIDHWGTPCMVSQLIVATGAWNFVCYQSSGSQLAFYVNGQSNSIAFGFYDWDIPNIAIGTNTAGGATTGASFSGDMDEVSLWSSVLTPSQLAMLYNGGAACKAHQ